MPQPTRLRRYEPGMPLCEGPVLVAGGGRFADGDRLARLGSASARWPRVVGARPTRSEQRSAPSSSTSARPVDPGELDRLRLLGAPAVKALERNARVVVIGTDPATLTEVAEVATQRALEGAVRSIGKELRDGATANLVLAQRDCARRCALRGRVLPLRPLCVRRWPGRPRRRVDGRVTRRRLAARRQGGGRHRCGSRHRCRDRPGPGPRRGHCRGRRRARCG